MWGKISKSRKNSLEYSLNIGKKYLVQEKFPKNFPKYEGKFKFYPLFFLKYGEIFYIYMRKKSKYFPKY
jgi:hypothetical protein